jgi:hypothetical protein
MMLVLYDAGATMLFFVFVVLSTEPTRQLHTSRQNGQGPSLHRAGKPSMLHRSQLQNTHVLPQWPRPLVAQGGQTQYVAQETAPDTLTCHNGQGPLLHRAGRPSMYSGQRRSIIKSPTRRSHLLVCMKIKG